ncbi:TPMT [Acanthosepion pharaonis]|uniref:thiopurine S-methyltransferase n=1 Tax=Acanthosepion pharaonis TaxID=158019 RepID=A0A812C6U7_ACAPH|nr:TPMT [Sepia pharaonis]
MHISLERHLDKFIAGRTGVKVLFPLCGKTIDMRLLADQGHYVVGVDIAERAFQEFFIEQNLEYTEEQLKNVDGKLFKSMDGRIKLYCMDFYLFTKEMEGHFNAIWDHASVVAINIEDRIKYSQLIQEVMSPDCKYIISAIQYDTSKLPGPPHNVSENDLKELFPNFSVQQFDEIDRSYMYKVHGILKIFKLNG